jgi:hypothetical protein
LRFFPNDDLGIRANRVDRQQRSREVIEGFTALFGGRTFL